MGKKFVVRLTEQELATMLAKHIMRDTLKNINLKDTPTDTTSTNSTTSATPTATAGNFVSLDLNKDSDYKAYAEIADKFISSRGSNLLGIRGSMLADAARNTFKKTGKYVPVELALAQLTEEGGFVKNPNARPIRTKNPFNVGNVDSGANVHHSSVQSGIQTYYDLIANKYLVGGKTASDLIKNFVNGRGNRYATNPRYEANVSKYAAQIQNLGAPVYASLQKKPGTGTVSV